MNEPVTLKVMSYNIHSGIGMDQKYDLDRIAGVIQQSGADVVGLQEVGAYWKKGGSDEHEAEVLARKLGMHVFYAPIYDLPPAQPGQGNRQFGNAILSKYPFTFTCNRDMTRQSTQVKNPEPEPMPGLAEVTLNIGGVTVHVYSFHLDFRKDARIRKLQVQELLEAVSGHGRINILLGDANAIPEAEEIQPLFQSLRDTWTEVSSEHGYTFPADKPRVKIDYILVSKDVETLSTDVIKTEASDHRPIIAELSFFEKSKNH